MNTIQKSLFAFLLSLVAIKTAGAQNCTDIKDYNSSSELHICIEPSPEDIDNSTAKPVFPPDEYSSIRCNLGDELTFKFIWGQNITRELFIGFLNRSGKVPVCKSCDISEVDGYLLDGTKNKFITTRWDAPFSWPNDEEGIRIPRLTEKGLNVPSGDIQITTKFNITNQFAGWNFNENPIVWMAISDYDKMHPILYCLDTRGGSTNVHTKTPAPSGPITVSQTNKSIHISSLQEGISQLTINTLDGKTIFTKQYSGKALSILTTSVHSGIYVIKVKSGQFNISRNLFIY